MTKKSEGNPGKAGAVELEEKELDEVQGAGFSPNFKGGIRVAAGDINTDGIAEISAGKFVSSGSANPTV